MTKEELAVAAIFLVADVNIRIHVQRQNGFEYKPRKSYPPLPSLMENKKFNIQDLARDFLLHEANQSVQGTLASSRPCSFR
jgi:hypothetical protein